MKNGLIYDNHLLISCHFPTIEEILPGQFMAAAFGRTDKGYSDFCVWISKTIYNGWCFPAKVVDGVLNDSLQHPLWHTFLFKAKEGKIVSHIN